MYSKYRPLLPQIAFNANTYRKSTPIQTWLSRIVCIDFVQVALVGAFILQTSFDKRTRVLLYTHDVLQSVPHSHQRLVSAINKHQTQSSIYRYAIAKLQKVFGFTSRKREKFGLGQEKSLKTKKVPKYLELIERFHIFAPSEQKF